MYYAWNFTLAADQSERNQKRRMNCILKRVQSPGWRLYFR